MALSTSAVRLLAGLQSEFLSSEGSQYKGGSVGLGRSVCALAKGVTLASAVALVNHAVVGSFPLMPSLLLKTVELVERVDALPVCALLNRFFSFLSFNRKLIRQCNSF